MTPRYRRTLGAFVLLFVLSAFVGLAILAAPAAAENGSPSGSGSAAVASEFNPKPVPAVEATAAIIMDMESGRVLYDKNADERLPMASTTKIMTGLLALEKLSAGQMVTASERACAAGESEMWLEPGEVISVEYLLQGLLVRSGNDAAIALAEAAAGTLEDFLVLMNARAKELGLANTSFSNPHGLDGANHYSSARDLARLGIIAMQHEEFRRIVGMQKVTIPWGNREGDRVFSSRNRLLKSVDYADGIKTGFTGKAGWCIVLSGTQRGASLIVVVLGGKTQDSRDEEARKLLEYGFSLYQERVLVEKSARVAAVPIPYHFGTEMPLVSESGLVRNLYHKDEIETVVDLEGDVSLPIERGQVLGKVTFVRGESTIGEVPLVAEISVGRATLGIKVKYFWALFANWVGGIV